MPKRVDRDARRATIIEATCRVIAAEGLEAATIRRIAAEVGCTTGLVTHYFATKDDILVASLADVFATATRRLNRDLHGPPLDALEVVLLDALPLTPQTLMEWRVWLVFWGRAFVADELLENQDQKYATWTALVEKLLRAAKEAGDLDARVDVETAINQTVALVDGLGLQGVFHPTPQTICLIRATVSDYIARLRPSERLTPPVVARL